MWLQLQLFMVFNVTEDFTLLHVTFAADSVNHIPPQTNTLTNLLSQRLPYMKVAALACDFASLSFQ
jgi:hypothetical protein